MFKTRLIKYCAEQNPDADVETWTKPTSTTEIPSVVTLSDSAIGNEFYNNKATNIFLDIDGIDGNLIEVPTVS